MSRLARLGQSLYDGRVSIDFVGRKWLWYGFSAVIIAVALSGLVFKQLNYGIEFEGGVEYRVSFVSGQADDDAVVAVRDAVMGTEIEDASSPTVNTSGSDGNLIRVQTEPLTTEESIVVDDAIRGVEGVEDLSSSQIGPSWGQQVAERALTGLVVFLVLVVLMIWAYFREWKMSVAALVALGHDLIITIGIYALVGFEVTPATVTGVLTILGFSLYDTVVVFDKVRENTAALSRTHQTYAEAANLAVNQTLVRSINTSIVALLPVGALLYVGAFVLGLRCPEGPVARALRRHGGRRLLLDLHRDPAPGAAQGARTGRQGRRPAGPAPPQPSAGRPLRRGAGVPRGHADPRRPGRPRCSAAGARW